MVHVRARTVPLRLDRDHRQVEARRVDASCEELDVADPLALAGPDDHRPLRAHGAIVPRHTPKLRAMPSAGLFDRSSSPTAARSPRASFARAPARDRHRGRGRAGRRGRVPHASRRGDRRDLARISPPTTSSRRRRGRRPTQSIRGTGFSPRTRPSPRSSSAPGSPGSGRPPRCCAPQGTSSKRSGSPEKAGVPVVETGAPDELGFPLMIKAAAGGRRPGHARRPLTRRAR